MKEINVYVKVEHKVSCSAFSESQGSSGIFLLSCSLICFIVASAALGFDSFMQKHYLLETVHALLACNAGTELSCIDNLERISGMSDVPILSTLIYQ